jgi:hypothetical protein
MEDRRPFSNRQLKAPQPEHLMPMFFKQFFQVGKNTLIEQIRDYLLTVSNEIDVEEHPSDSKQLLKNHSRKTWIFCLIPTFW